MVSKDNKRIFVTVPDIKLRHLKKIVSMYNDSVPESLIVRQAYGIKKISVSSLYALAIDNLILSLDNELQVNESYATNKKRVFNFLCPNKNYQLPIS